MTDEETERMADLTRKLADTAIDYKQRCEELEAKLARAMEQCAQIAESHKPSAALLADRYWRGVDEAAHSIAVEIYATLAELKGQDND